MAMLPGWNSLEAVGSIGHSLHMAAMVVLALLVVAEGLALVYDDRKYALIGMAEGEITLSRGQEAQAITERHHSEIAALQRELEEARGEDALLRLTTIGQLAQEAGWNATRINEAALTTNHLGIEVLYREPPRAAVPPPALAALVDVLVDLRILPVRSVTICEELVSEVIRLAVGTRSATADLHSSLLPTQPPPSIPSDSEVRNGTEILDAP